MTETCKSKTLKSQGIHHAWCFHKKEESTQCRAKTQSQSFYDAFTAFLSSPCTVDLEENDINESLHSNTEHRKLPFEDDKKILMRQSAANTGCNEEILGKRVNYKVENCVSTEKFVTNFWLTKDRLSIEKTLTKPVVSLSLADSNMSHDWPACKAYKDEYLPTHSSAKGLRNLRSQDIYVKCRRNERKTGASRSTFLERSTIGENFLNELSCDEKKPLKHHSFSSTYKRVKKFTSTDNYSRYQNSEIQFLMPRNLKLGINVNNESVSSVCQLQHKEDYRRKLRSAHGLNDLRAISKLCHLDRAHQSRLSSLRRRNSLTSDGYDLGNDCSLKCITQKVLCRPVFVVLEKMSKKKIEQMQNVMKMCPKVSDSTESSDVKETGESNGVSDSARNDGIVNTSGNARTDKIPKVPIVSRTENEEDSNCTKAGEVNSTLHSRKRETNLEASQVCFDCLDVSMSNTEKTEDAAMSSNSSEVFENSDVRNSQSRNYKICENVPLSNLQEVSDELLNVRNTKEVLKTSSSDHLPEFTEIIPDDVTEHEIIGKPETQRTCSSRTSCQFGVKESLHEANDSVCLPTICKTLDQRDFEPELDLSSIDNSSGAVNVIELVKHSELLGINPVSVAVTSNTTKLLKELPKTIAKSDILQDTTKTNAEDIFDQQDTDLAKYTSQPVDKVEVVITSLNILNPSPSGPLRMKNQGTSSESKPAVNCETQARCNDNPEYCPKSSTIDKRKKKRSSTYQNDFLGLGMLGTISEYQKDCLKQNMTTPLHSTKAKKRKVECHVDLQKVPCNHVEDADSYVPNFMTHSQFMVDESSLAEKWKETTDLEEWWLSDLGNWMNLSALGSTISPTAAEENVSSENFRWCAMLADQSEWPEVELDCPSDLKKSADGYKTNFPVSLGAGQGQAVHEEDVNSSEFDVDKCEDCQSPETLGTVEKFKCMKRTACRVGKRKQVQWLKLKETGSLNTRLLTTTAGREMELKAANSELTDTFHDVELSDNAAVTSVVMGIEAANEKPDVVNKMTTSFMLSEALKEKSREEKADNSASASPSAVGILSVTCTASDTNTICTPYVTSVILSSNHMQTNENALFSCNPCDDPFSHTSSVAAYCHASSEALFSHACHVLSRSTSYLNLRCSPAFGSFRHGHCSSSVAPLSQNHFNSHFDSNSCIASVSQNLSDSHFNSNSVITSFNDDPSLAYFMHPIVPRSHAVSKSHFTHNICDASCTCASLDKQVSVSIHDQLSRCQTISDDPKLNCIVKLQDSSQHETETKGITTGRRCDPVTIKEKLHSNTEKPVIRVTCSTVDSSSLAIDSAVTMVRNIGIGLNLDSSSFSIRTGNNYAENLQQAMVKNEFYQKLNFVYNESKHSKICPTSCKGESCGTDLASSESSGDHFSLGFLAESKSESPLIRVGLHMQSRSLDHNEIVGEEFCKDSIPSISCAGLCRRFSKLDHGLICDSFEALDMVSENSSQDCQSEASSKPHRKDLDSSSPSSDDAFMYNDCNSDMCSWLAASMGLYTCECGAAFSDSWSCQQHQSRCNAMIRI